MLFCIFLLELIFIPMTLSIFLMGLPGGPELLIIVLVILLLFGGRKIPELMKGVGKGIKEFKNASKNTDDKKE
jgi:sec-independent protein translocase protein TatA